MRTNHKVLGSLLFLFLVSVILIKNIDLAEVFKHVQSIDMMFLLAASVFIFMTFAVSTARLKLIMEKFGVEQAWLTSHKINIFSLLYSLIAIPLVSQIIGRIVHSAEDKNKTALAPITILEKSLSMTIMISFAMLASFFYFNDAFITADTMIALSLSQATIVIVAGVSLIWIFSKDEAMALVASALALRKLGLITSFVLSLAMQICIILSYVFLAKQFLPTTPSMTLAAAFTYVVLATTVPVGTGGWGVREVAAGSSFAIFGLPVEVGVISALLYGVLHLAVLIVQAPFLQRAASHASTYRAERDQFKDIAFWQLCLAAVFLFLAFQIRLPVFESKITINLIDPIALMTAINVLLIAYFNRGLKTFWQDQGIRIGATWVGLACFGAMISLGWAVGYFAFGSNSWATANRFFGLISVMSFLITGAALRKYLSPIWHLKLAILLGGALIASTIIQMIFQIPLSDIGRQYFNWDYNISGFVGDRNAFAFLGLMAITLILFTAHQVKDDEKPGLIIPLIGMIAGVIVYSGSRTGMIGLGFLLVWMLMFRRRDILTVVAASIAINLFFIALYYLLVEIYIYFSIVPEASEIASFLGGRTSLDRNLTLTQSRYDTWMTGWHFFLDAPLLGAGLGASVEQTNQVIHNLYLWVIGEMGLIGGLLSLPFVMIILKMAKTDYTNRANSHAFILLFCFLVGCFTVTHDIIYQRGLWLSLGFLLASAQIPTPHTGPRKGPGKG